MMFSDNVILAGNSSFVKERKTLSAIANIIFIGYVILQQVENVAIEISLNLVLKTTIIA